METGRVIQRRYLLQHLIRQGQTCTIYQATDQVLQRSVAVKVVPAEHMTAYRAAIRATAQFTHPNIVDLYDLIVEPDSLYIVQEFVEGDDFAALLQQQLSPFQIAELGLQISQALIYAGVPSRGISHGDLTPAAILRDKRGQVRVNGFALPSDLSYFTAWSIVGGDGFAVSDQQLSWGQQSEARRADDVRATGILLYQLLAGRQAGAGAGEPPSDGRLRFQRGIPPEFCELVARSIIRQHPQRIATAEAFYTELKAIAQLLEPPPPVPVTSGYALEDAMAPGQFVPRSTGQLVGPLSAQAGLASGRLPGTSAAMFTGEISPAAPTLPDVSMKFAATRQELYPGTYTSSATTSARRVSMPILIGLGAILFVLFFIIGYFVSLAVFH